MKPLISEKYKLESAVDYNVLKKDFPDNIRTAFFIFSEKLRNILRKNNFSEKDNILFRKDSDSLFCFIPSPGAPGTIIKAERLRKQGIRDFIIIGTSAGIYGTDFYDVHIVISSIIGEGTSGSYIDEKTEKVFSCKYTNEIISGILKKNNVKYSESHAWTTDAPLRETFEEIRILREKGVSCIDMECSALFSFMEFYKDVRCSAVFVISDIFTEDKWESAFHKKELYEKLALICNILYQDKSENR